MILFGEKSLRRSIGEYISHYHKEPNAIVLTRAEVRAVLEELQGPNWLAASPRLVEPEGHTLRQRQLASALCRYLEMAKPASAA